MELIYEKLSYKIIGILYKVYNTLGYGYQEKDYQKAIESELADLGLPFKRELYSNIRYNNKVLSKFFADFLIDNKILLEIKVANRIYSAHFNQVLQYLKSNNLKLAIIGAFTPEGILIKRVINDRTQSKKNHLRNLRYLRSAIERG